jgi:hypothetical protein
VMQYTVRDHHIETLLAEWRLEQVHLQEGRVRDAKPLPESSDFFWIHLVEQPGV